MPQTPALWDKGKWDDAHWDITTVHHGTAPSQSHTSHTRKKQKDEEEQTLLQIADLYFTLTSGGLEK